MAEMSELPPPSNASESSTGNDMPTKRRAPPRSSHRIARKDTAEDGIPSKQPIKQESKPEKKKQPRPKPDTDRETVVTEHGYSIHPNDHIYLISEPPGEPYYIARIMEFIYVDPFSTSLPEHIDLPISSTTGRKVKSIRVNWFYRPQDISHKTQTDTRCLYATMHSDVNPIQAVRGLCTVRHRSEIPNREFEEYKRGDDQFWFSRLHDRYIQRNYDVVPTGEITNVPDRVAEVLREKWKYVVVENGAKKELCMEPRRCTKCGEWCRSSESVRCTECHTDWHMKCVKPPLPRKPTKGYHWACGPCIRTRMKEMRANNIPMFELKKTTTDEDDEDDEYVDDESEELSESGIPESAGPITRADTPVTQFDITDGKDHSRINEGKFNVRLWPYRYLGIHCKVEDVLDDQDRIYPRAASRIGPRHQAVVPDWPGRPVEYIERRPVPNFDKIDKRKKRTAVTAVKEGTETPEDSSIHTGIDEDRPPWIQEKPPGYVVRGEDDYSTDGTGTQLVWKKPANVTDAQIDTYLNDLQSEATRLKIPPFSTSFLDGAISALQYTSFDFQKAKESVSTITTESLWNPIFSPEEVKRFEAGVTKFGSELHLVAKEVGTKATAECVRFYYMWKKTPPGREIWGKQEGRKGNRQKSVTTAAEGLPDVGDSSDDSAFDDRKATRMRKRFECKFCQTRTSRRWRKPPGGLVIGGTDGTSILALCDRCGELWRRYGVQYVIPEELKKPVEGKVPKKRRTEDEEEDTTVKRKKVKKDDKANSKVIRRTRAGSIEQFNYPPCAVCGYVEDDEPVTCHICGLCVHAGCYGSMKKNRKGNWACDMCINDKQPLVSTKYECVLCSVRESTELDANGDLPPRQPLKPTANNNWAHVTCAIFSPETRFGSSKHLKPVEGIGSIPPARWTQLCSLCEIPVGATINCHDCKLPVHVSCALIMGFTAGFDIQPVKGSRRDVVQIVSFGGETGVMTAGVWCPEHDLRKTIVHPLTEIDPVTQETALMTYVSTYKQADLALTGTMRKAQLAATAAKTSRRQFGPARSSSPGPGISDQLKRRVSETSTMSQLLQQAEEKVKQCEKCHVRFSPIWWPVEHGKDVDEHKVLCHKCHWGIIHGGNGVVNGDAGSRAENTLANGIQDTHVGRTV